MTTLDLYSDPQAEDDYQWWLEIGDSLGQQLRGFSGRLHATFDRSQVDGSVGLVIYQLAERNRYLESINRRVYVS